MHDLELKAYADRGLFKMENNVLAKITPVILDLIAELSLLPYNSSARRSLASFEKAIKKINEFSNDIATEEREAILGVIYDIGGIVGLSSATRFAERWRGDW